MRSVLRAVLLLACACASQPPRQLTPDPNIERGHADEIAAAKRVCFLSDEHVTLDRFVQAAKDIRPSGVTAAIGRHVDDCAADLYVTHSDGVNTAFRMSDGKMRVLYTADGPAYGFAVAVLMVLVEQNGPETATGGIR